MSGLKVYAVRNSDGRAFTSSASGGQAGGIQHWLTHAVIHYKQQLPCPLTLLNCITLATKSTALFQSAVKDAKMMSKRRLFSPPCNMIDFGKVGCNATLHLLSFFAAFQIHFCLINLKYPIPKKVKMRKYLCLR